MFELAWISPCGLAAFGGFVKHPNPSYNILDKKKKEVAKCDLKLQTVAAASVEMLGSCLDFRSLGLITVFAHSSLQPNSIDSWAVSKCLGNHIDHNFTRGSWVNSLIWTS